MEKQWLARRARELGGRIEQTIVVAAGELIRRRKEVKWPAWRRSCWRIANTGSFLGTASSAQPVSAVHVPSQGCPELNHRSNSPSPPLQAMQRQMLHTINHHHHHHHI
jgi:hypothetical protein